MSIIKTVLITCMMVMALSSSGYSLDRSGFTKSDLADILKTEWMAYRKDKPNFNGGLAMQILSPEGDHFIAAGFDEAVTNGFHFRIASVTKTFTAAAIVLLNQKGALRLDDKITDNIPGTNNPYIPDTPDYDLPYKKDITIRMLLMHRAGIFDVSNNVIPDNEFSHGEPYVGQNYLEYVISKDNTHTFTFEELAGIVAKNHLSFFAPGDSYHYSDTGYSMLGEIVERVSGKRYADFVKDELAVPNGLLSTSAPWKGDDQTLPKPFVHGYVWANGVAEDVTESNMSPHVSEGNIITTPIDLANWCKKLMTGKAGISKESVEMMKAGMGREDGTDATYGLGILYLPGIGYGHAGAHEGYLTLMYYDPKTDFAYVMFTNEWDIQNNLDSIKIELKYMMEIANKIFKKMGY